mmetsp:Transcript_1291/g.3767  ORF Transcript_1291/g.3767 Transcript_1291/m.3767 type:complete len:218 (-) Transcript_1291:861-1514(-)
MRLSSAQICGYEPPVAVAFPPTTSTWLPTRMAPAPQVALGRSGSSVIASVPGTRGSSAMQLAVTGECSASNSAPAMAEKTPPPAMSIRPSGMAHEAAPQRQLTMVLPLWRPSGSAVGSQRPEPGSKTSMRRPSSRLPLATAMPPTTCKRPRSQGTEAAVQNSRGYTMSGRRRQASAAASYRSTSLIPIIWGSVWRCHPPNATTAAPSEASSMPAAGP